VSVTTSRAFWVTGPCAGELREEPLAPTGPAEVRVRTRFSAISRGTESIVYRNEVPVAEHERMRAPFQSGNFPCPVKYGYISVGDVEAGPETLIGRTVFCLHPHQDRYVVPASAVTPIPDAVPAERAILAANLETAINGIWDAGPGIGDRIAVIGGGAVGCLLAWLAARIPGCDVELIDINEARRATAERLGARFATPATARDDVDIVLHASGNPAGLSCALDIAGREARIVELSWFGQKPATLSLGGAFHSRRLTLQSSQVGSLPANRQARWDFQRRLGLALSLLTDPGLDELITADSHFDALPATMHRLSVAADDVICHRVRYA